MINNLLIIVDKLINKIDNITYENKRKIGFFLIYLSTFLIILLIINIF